MGQGGNALRHRDYSRTRGVDGMRSNAQPALAEARVRLSLRTGLARPDSSPQFFHSRRHRLLTRDRILDSAVLFVPDQSMHTALREPVHEIVPMLPHPLQIGSHADIQRPKT